MTATIEINTTTPTTRPLRKGDITVVVSRAGR
jgi:hypothetical protein